MIFEERSLQYMTSAELEEAIRRHRDHTKALIAEARARRATETHGTPWVAVENPADELP